MQEINSPIDNLPLEILHSLMKFMDGCDLYLFSMTCRRLYSMISNSEELWDNCYALSVPQIHRALLQTPVPSYWAFSEPMSRRFVYLCVVAKNRRSINDMDSVIDVMRKNTHSEGLLLIASYVVRRLTFTPTECKQSYKDKVSKNRLYFGQNGAIGLLLDLLQDQFKSANLMAAVLCALNNICCNIGRNCRTIIREDGIATILNVMKNYSSDISVLDYGSAVLANISRELKGDWTDLIVSEGVNLTKKLLESEETVPVDSIVSGVDLFAILAKTNSRFRKSFGRVVLPLIKDLLVKHTDEPSLVMSCSRALLEFFHCPDNNSLVEELNLIPLLLNRLENERNNTLAFYIISALNSLFWKKTVNNGKDYFYRYVTLVIDRLKKGLVEKKFELAVALILGNIANHDADNLKLIKSFQISKMMTEVIKKHSNGHDKDKYNHILHLFQE